MHERVKSFAPSLSGPPGPVHVILESSIDFRTSVSSLDHIDPSHPYYRSILSYAVALIPRNHLLSTKTREQIQTS